jgi:predicted RNA binding protein YcfA (HicA-like mRNA interferase family)
VPAHKVTPIPFGRLVKVFEVEGFAIQRQKGDHLILTKLGVKRPVVIKTSPREVPVTHILTYLRTAGISRENQRGEVPQAEGELLGIWAGRSTRTRRAGPATHWRFSGPRDTKRQAHRFQPSTLSLAPLSGFGPNE